MATSPRFSHLNPDEERELREGLRARGFPDDAIGTWITVHEARAIVDNITPERCLAIRASGKPGEVLALVPENGKTFLRNVPREEAVKRFNGGTALEPAAPETAGAKTDGGGAYRDQPGKPPIEPEQPVEDAAPEAPKPQPDSSEGFIPRDAVRAHVAQAAVPNMSDITALRLHLRRGGFDPIPVEGKIPHMNGWQTKLNVGDAEIRLCEKSYHLAHNTGVLAKFAPGLDIDIMHEAAAKAVEMLAREFFEEHGNIYVRFGKPPKRLILLRTDEPFTKLSRVFAEPKGPDGKEPKIEILGDGQQYVVDGTHSETGKPYSLFGGDLETIRRDNLPYVRREDIERFLDAATKLLVEEFGFTLKSAAG